MIAVCTFFPFPIRFLERDYLSLLLLLRVSLLSSLISHTLSFFGAPHGDH